MAKKVVKKVTKKKVVKKVKIKTEYTDYSEFAKRVGILEEEDLEKLGWPCDNGNRICCSKHTELVKFMNKLNKPSNAEKFILGKKTKAKKKYHIATDLDAGDLEGEYVDKHGIKEDENGSTNVFAIDIVNRVAYVNRMDYFLCDGDANEDLCLAEINDEN